MTPASRLGEADRRHLRRAVELGRRGWGRVHPNPLVGAVVARAGNVLAEACHEEFGAPHAEVLALAAAGDARDSTVYSSLEPCAHTGKTPPCTDALVAAGVARVVYWASEPGRRAGGGGAQLRAAGVQTDGPFGSPAEWAAENPFFHHRRPRPFVALKLAVSADARIAPRNGRRAWITGSPARREAHRLRAGFDAVLVGTGTWKADDPRLTVRGPVTPRVAPARVLLDRAGQVSPEARAFDPPGGPALVAVDPGRADALRSRLGSRAEVVPVPTTAPGDGGNVCAPRSRRTVAAPMPVVASAPTPATAHVPPAAPMPAAALREALPARVGPPCLVPTLDARGEALPSRGGSPVPERGPSGSPGLHGRARPVPALALDMAALLAALDNRGYARVLCEGGGRLGASLLAAGHVDRLYLFFAPQRVGRDGVPALPPPIRARETTRGPATSQDSCSVSPLARYVEALAARAGADPHMPPPGWRIALAPARFGADALVVLDRDD